MSLAEFVKIVEELFDSNALHNNSCPQTVLNIWRIIRNFNTWLSVSICKNVDVVSFLVIERSSLGWCYTSGPDRCGLSSFWRVSWENILWSVQVLAELEVVHFGCCSTVTISPDNQVKELLGRWHETQIFHHTKELVRCNVERLWSIKVLETWLQENPLWFDLVVKSSNCVHHSIFFSICEHLQFKHESKWKLLNLQQMTWLCWWLNLGLRRQRRLHSLSWRSWRSRRARFRPCAGIC